MARRRKRYLAGKYIFRRILITLILLSLAGAGCWLAYNGISGLGLPKTAETAAPVLPEPESAPNSKSESSAPPDPKPEPESEPETEPESKPEPEPEPVGASPGDWELILVNPTNPLPENYKMELETITDAYRVDARAADSLKSMFAQARQDGITLIICSAYRSVEKQEELFAAKEREYIDSGKDEQAATAMTATIIAVPGTSEHHTGLAVDIVTPSYTVLDSGFADTPAFKWLDENAHKFGFIMRYPEDKQDITKIIYEPWHYRYVGEYNASLMKERELCLEEYVEYLTKGGENSKPESESDEQAEPDAEVKTD